MSSTTLRETVNDYYAAMDTPAMVLASLVAFIIILFFIYILIEVLSRRDFTIMRKTLWTVSFMITPIFSHIFYLIFGDREEIDRFGDPVY